jgi:hypothetical protein
MISFQQVHIHHKKQQSQQKAATQTTRNTMAGQKKAALKMITQLLSELVDNTNKDGGAEAEPLSERQTNPGENGEESVLDLPDPISDYLDGLEELEKEIRSCKDAAWVPKSITVNLDSLGPSMIQHYLMYADSSLPCALAPSFTPENGSLEMKIRQRVLNTFNGLLTLAEFMVNLKYNEKFFKVRAKAQRVRSDANLFALFINSFLTHCFITERYQSLQVECHCSCLQCTCCQGF